MKVTLDITKLLQDGSINQAESEKLQQLAARDTGSLAINMLLGFGVVAVSAGAVALIPTATTAIAIGLIIDFTGLSILFQKISRWNILANIAVIVGSLMFGAGLIIFNSGSLECFMILAVFFALTAVVAQSGLLIVIAVLTLFASLGASTGYASATYVLAVTQPTLTILVFSAIALIAFLTSKRLSSNYEQLAVTAARTSLLLVNLGFWIGSLWGDNPLEKTSDYFNQTPIIPDMVFVVGWAIGLLCVGIWGMMANRRWVVNVVAVFGAIHFYTQWFERLGANPSTVLVGGLIMIIFALGLLMFNRLPKIA